MPVTRWSSASPVPRSDDRCMSTASCSWRNRSRSSAIASFSFVRDASIPPSRINPMIRLSSSRSNQVPCFLHRSTITPEQPAKFIRFINCEHSGHGTYFTLLISPPETVVAGVAVPRTADCCSRSAQIFSNDLASTQSPSQREHSRNVVVPITTDFISIWQRGHKRAAMSALSGTTAAAPHRGQCLLPRNIMPKHEGQEIVARRDPQNAHNDASVELAAPQFGQ